MYFLYSKLNKYLTNELMPHFPVCLPTREILDNMFWNKEVKISGYGRIESIDKRDKNHNPNACKLQVGKSKIVKPTDPSCKDVSFMKND